MNISEVIVVVGSHVSTNPNINFIVYVPTRDQSPLIIYDESGPFVTTSQNFLVIFINVDVDVSFRYLVYVVVVEHNLVVFPDCVGVIRFGYYH